MREKSIEAKLVKAVKAKGGLALKFVSPGMDGMPDRLVLMPNGVMCFVELKADPKKKPRALQLLRHKQLRELGYKVFVVDVTEKINDVLLLMGGEDIEV